MHIFAWYLVLFHVSDEDEVLSFLPGLLSLASVSPHHLWLPLLAQAGLARALAVEWNLIQHEESTETSKH